MRMMSAGAGKGLLRLINEGHPSEWAAIAASVVLAWVVMPALFRRERNGLACSLAGVLLLAWTTILISNDRPSAAVGACLGLAVFWLGAAIVISRQSSQSPAQNTDKNAESDTPIERGNKAEPGC